MDAVLMKTEGPVAWIILNRPDKRNALSLAVMKAFREILQRIESDASVRVVIVKGNGPAFCAGHDLNELVGKSQDLHHFRTLFTECTRLMEGLHRLPQPVIAQVHGIATAAGCQLVAACDLALAERGARFATPGVKIGLFCSTPMVPLVRVIGRRRALEMLLTGRFVSAEEAKAFGLVNRVTAPEALEEETRAWAVEIAQFSGFTLSFGKRTFYGQVDLPESAAYTYAKEAISMNCLAEDAQEGMRAFLEKRPPVWKGR